MKPNLLYKISLVLSGVSTVALVAAMIACAVRGDKSRAVALIAIASAAVAFIGIILAGVSTKMRNDKTD